MSLRGLLLLLVVLAALVAGCGDSNDGDQQTVTVTNPVASTPDATTPPTDATQPGTTAVTPPPDTTQTAPPPEAAEQRVRVPASFTISSGRLEPPTITVPPFLAVEVSARSDDGRAHRLVVRTPQPRTLDVPAGGRDAVQVPGLRAGTYPIELDGRRAGELLVGGEVGP